MPTSLQLTPAQITQLQTIRTQALRNQGQIPIFTMQKTWRLAEGEFGIAWLSTEFNRT